jgi:hypothetical protein
MLFLSQEGRKGGRQEEGMTLSILFGPAAHERNSTRMRMPVGPAVPGESSEDWVFCFFLLL